MYQLAGQEMNVKKLCRRENITNHEEDHSGFHLGSLLYLSLFFSFWICSGDVICWPRLTLGSLFDSSSDLVSLAVSFNC